MEAEEVKIALVEVKRKKYEGVTPAKEILESIVADVLKHLGFRVETNKMLKAKGEEEIEADVWGIKGNTFCVYASCKNWNREVDRNTIFSEVGRISNLNQSPHLKIFVAKKLTESARETALKSGFIVIELGEKAEKNNAEEIYDTVHKHLREIFIVAKETRDVSIPQDILKLELEREKEKKSKRPEDLQKEEEKLFELIRKIEELEKESGIKFGGKEEERRFRIQEQTTLKNFLTKILTKIRR